MHLFDLLRMQEPSFDPAKAKVHLARYNQIDQPIDVYRRGEFDEWQRWQNGHNFNCPFVVSLIQDGSATRWMFAGLFKPTGHTIEHGDKRDHYYYDLERIESTAALEGRLFCTSGYTKRNSYVYCSTVGDMTVSEILRERLSIGTFPGYKRVDISKDDLDLLVRSNTES